MSEWPSPSSAEDAAVGSPQALTPIVVEQALADLNSIMLSIAQQFPENKGIGADVQPLALPRQPNTVSGSIGPGEHEVISSN